VRRCLQRRKVAGCQGAARGTRPVGPLADVHERRRAGDVEVHVGERSLNAEHHRRRAYAEGEREDGRDGECSAARKLTPGVTQVFANLAEH
jgi:hypothetical protein